MAASDISMTLECADGSSLKVLANLIEKRTQLLRQTTQEAVIATAIDVLKSVRARTRKADPDKATGTVGLRSDLVVGFKTVAGRRVPCIRVGSKHGAKYSGSWRQAGTGRIDLNVAKVYFVRDVVGENRADKRTYVIVANSEGDAKKWAQSYNRARIARYAGMAKFALGVAMSETSSGAADASGAANSLIRGVVCRTVSVSRDGGGFSAGSFSVEVRDMLSYAMNALDGGEGVLTIAIQKAANSAAGKINKLARLPLNEQIETPFPEVKGR